jgi:hypothetical protein
MEHETASITVIGSLSCQVTEVVEQPSHYHKNNTMIFKFGTAIISFNVVRNTSLKLKTHTHVCSSPLFVKDGFGRPFSRPPSLIEV